MAFPLRHLPVLQNWDCHVCGTCCKEYLVQVTDEERRRIEAQGWEREPDFAGLHLFKRHGPPWARRYTLNHRADGSCVFLRENGRCRIHERFGYETKPLACRLFPFVLVPVADHWRVGLRFACPSAAANKGRPLDRHDDDLKDFAARLAEREGLAARPDGTLIPPPPLQAGQHADWPDVLRFVQALLVVLKNRRDRMERRLRKSLALVELCREARVYKLKGVQLTEVLEVLVSTLDRDVPVDPETLPPPSWVGRVLFRLATAYYTRKDHGPNRGIVRHGRVGLLFAASRFAVGRGAVPAMHGWLPENSAFEEAEKPRGLLPDAVEEILERYYVLKVGSLQFCGPAYFGLPFWEGFEALAMTFPVLLWVSRVFGRLPPVEAVTRALSIVDDHFGFNRVLATYRQRLSFSILARRGELARLIAWYSR
jgi:lysine-N-methylase